MGFIESATTVNVEAKLTFKGKQRLYNLIEGDGTFITKFGLGDSDTDYKAVPTTGPLDSGHVPETGSFKPRPRSLVLYKGMFRPGVPVIFFDNEPGPVDREFSIGSNSEGNTLVFNVSTQWPTGENYSEDYYYELQNPTSLSDEVFDRAFTIQKIGAQFTLTFIGNLSINELTQLVGSVGDAFTDIVITITGRSTNKRTAMNVRLIF